MRRLVLFPLLAVVLCACGDPPIGPPPEGVIDLAGPWHTVSPAAVSLDAAALFAAGERAADIDRMRSLLVVRDGRLAYERYFHGMGVDSLADVRSVTKSVVSTLVGIAIDEGDIDDIDQPITDFLDDSEYPVRREHGEVTIRHLLTMSSGWPWAEDNNAGYNDWLQSDDHIGYVLNRDLESAPGTAFTYNSAAVHLLGVIVAEAVGKPLPAFADEVLFGPLGIRAREWEELPEGVVNGGAGLDLRPRDLARLGLLYLQQGWSGTRSVVSPGWVAEASSPQWPIWDTRPPIGRESYGFLWWMDISHGAYIAWGYGGQFIYVVPRLNLVVVATTEWRGVSQDIGPRALQDQVLRLIIERVLPAAD